MQTDYAAIHNIIIRVADFQSLSHCLTTTTQAFNRSKSSRGHVTREGKLAILPPSHHSCGSTQSGLALTCRSKSPTIRKLAYYAYLSFLSFTHAFTQSHQKYFLRKELDSTQLENPSHCCTPFHSAPGSQTNNRKKPNYTTQGSQKRQGKVTADKSGTYNAQWTCVHTVHSLHRNAFYRIHTWGGQ
jgi:hypothetical protein